MWRELIGEVRYGKGSFHSPQILLATLFNSYCVCCMSPMIYCVGTDKPTKASQEAVTVNTICGVLLPGLVALVVGVM